MRRRLLSTMLLGLTVGGSGCATALNVQDAAIRKPYGGVTMPLIDFFGGSESGDHSEYGALFFWPFWVLDKPLSLVGDTLTLPYILYSRRNTPPSTNNKNLQFPSSSPSSRLAGGNPNP